MSCKIVSKRVVCLTLVIMILFSYFHPVFATAGKGFTSPHVVDAVKSSAKDAPSTGASTTAPRSARRDSNVISTSTDTVRNERSDASSIHGSRRHRRFTLLKVIGNKSTVVNKKQSLKERIKEYRSILNISKHTEVNVRIVNKLFERREKNYENFQKIVKVSGVASKAEDKETIVRELLDMDEKFTSRFVERVLNKPKVRRQLIEYVKFLKLKRVLSVRVRREHLSNLFARKISEDEFIELIWKSI